MDVWLLRCLAIGVFLILTASKLLHSQDDPPSAAQPSDQFFAGVVTAISETSVTVTRTVLGKDSSVRTFSITHETQIEGKAKLKSKVTVRFVTEEDGDRAVRIIVRGSAPAPKKQ